MKTLINLISRATALYSVRCLEIELNDQTHALQQVGDVDTFRAICAARNATQRALACARQHYIGLLPPGERRVWTLA